MTLDHACQNHNGKAGHKIKALSLSSFRNYDRAELKLSQDHVVITGLNGAGKTNILEALSFFSPGKGLRGADLQDVQKISSQTEKNATPPQSGWAVFADFEDQYAGQFSLSTGMENHDATKRAKRHVRLEGENSPQSTLADYTAILWLTPQMDRLFLDSASHRRRFLDRLVFNFDPAHAGRTTRYEKAMRQRSRLLKDHVAEPVWLDSLEQSMAETGVAIAAARLRMLDRLQAVIDQTDYETPAAMDMFPKALLKLNGLIEDSLQYLPALQVEEDYKARLRQTRALDAITGGAKDGVHKTDLIVSYAQKNMAAAQCSTGEQKALLTALILSHAELVKLDRGIAPILLLDEITAHYDEMRRMILFERLHASGHQIWLTGTEENLFDFFRDKADYITISDGKITA